MESHLQENIYTMLFAILSHIVVRQEFTHFAAAGYNQSSRI